MKINHKLVDRIAVTMFLYCLSSLAVLLVLCYIRVLSGTYISDIFILGVALLSGLFVTSRNRVEALSDWSHRLFRRSY